MQVVFVVRSQPFSYKIKSQKLKWSIFQVVKKRPTKVGTYGKGEISRKIFYIEKKINVRRTNKYSN